MTGHRLRAGGTGGAAPDAAAGATFHDRTPSPTWPASPPIWMTNSTDHREHAIGEEELAAGHWQKSGIYRAMCGSTLTPAALTMPPGRRCQGCSTGLADLRRRQTRSPGRLASNRRRQKSAQ